MATRDAKEHPGPQAGKSGTQALNYIHRQMRISVIIPILVLTISCSQRKNTVSADNRSSDYLGEIKKELIKKWPDNRTINLVFHGHSVPAGYFRTPHVNTFGSYPYLVLRQLKELYPNAVINVINTSVGGETSVTGQKRFESDVLNHKPEVLFIDYALNDRRVGLEESRKAWEKMIQRAKQDGIKIILLTPSPDLKVNMADPDNELEQYASQIRALSEKYNTGLVDSYALFKKLDSNCHCVADYMAQYNHPNEKGHLLIAAEIMKYFID